MLCKQSFCLHFELSATVVNMIIDIYYIALLILIYIILHRYILYYILHTD